jgi:hypothetical protein
MTATERLLAAIKGTSAAETEAKPTDDEEIERLLAGRAPAQETDPEVARLLEV